MYAAIPSCSLLRAGGACSHLLCLLREGQLLVLHKDTVAENSCAVTDRHWVSGSTGAMPDDRDEKQWLLPLVKISQNSPWKTAVYHLVAAVMAVSWRRAHVFQKVLTDCTCV